MSQPPPSLFFAHKTATKPQMPSRQRLREMTRAYQSRAIRPATRSARKSQVRNYLQFCQAAGYEAFSRRQGKLKESVLSWITWRAEQSPVTVKYLAAGVSQVRQEARSRGRTIPKQPEWPELRELLDGIANSGPSKPRRPAFRPSAESLRKTLQRCWLGPKRKRIFGLTVALKIFTGMRTSNVLERPKRLTAGVFCGLRWRDVQLGDVTAVIRTSWAKSSKTGKDWELHKLPSEARGICPVRALQAARKERSRRDEFVCSIDGKPYTPRMFEKDYRRWVVLTQRDQQRLETSGHRLAPHGLRAVVPSLASEQGVPEEVVMKAFGWKSRSAYKLYVRPDRK